MKTDNRDKQLQGDALRHFDIPSDFRRLLVTVTLVAISTCFQANWMFGQSPTSDVQWLTGSQVDRANQLPLSVWWADAPIRDRFQSFSIHNRLGLFLDRRIDPGLKINLGINHGTTEQFLWNVASKYQMGVCRIEDFYYFGPPQTAQTLPIACSQLAIESQKNRRNYRVSWRDVKAIQTDSVVQPKTLLQSLAAENQFEINNLESLPLDVWSGFQLPPTTLEGRVAIILAGFGKWFERSPDGKTIRIVDFPKLETGKISVSGIQNARKLLTSLRLQFPNLKVSLKEKTNIIASGQIAELAVLREKIVELQSAKTDPNSSSTFTLTKVTNLRINFLKTIAQNTNHELVIPTPPPPSLSELIDLNLINVELTEMIAAILEGTNLKFELSNGKLTISAQ